MNLLNKIISFTISLLFLTILTACGGGSVGTGTTGQSYPTTEILHSSIMYLPSSLPNSASFSFYNSVFKPLKLDSVEYNGSVVYSQGSPLDKQTAIDISNCMSVLSGDSCSIGVKNVESPATIVVGLKFVDNVGNHYFFTQSIVYTSDSYEYNYNSSNFTILGSKSNVFPIYVGPKQITQKNISFILNADYMPNSIKLSTDNSNVTTNRISCLGYTKGSICTANIVLDNSNNQFGRAIQVDVGYTISGTIMSSQRSNSAVDKSNLAGKASATGSSLILAVNLVSQPSLIINPSNITVSPADGAHSQLVTISNVGNESALIGQITASNPLYLASNLCSNVILGVGSSCTFAVNANSPVSGSANILVPYTGISGTNYPVINLNVVYIGSQQGSSESIVAGDGSLQNAIVNSTNNVLDVIITNTGTTTLNSINFASNKPSNVTYGAYGSSSSCKTDGTQSLSPGYSCTLSLKYSPTVVESGTFLLSSYANYIDVSGGVGTVTAGPINIGYSAIRSPAILTINPSNAYLTINADGYSSTNQVFIVTNNGSVRTTITAESIPVGLAKIADTCLNQQIVPNGSCSIITKFGPSSTSVNSVNTLTVTYQPSTVAQPIYAYATVNLVATTTALIQITNVTESGIFTGSVNNFSFTNTPLVSFVINFTYTNNGVVPASNFTTKGALPIGWYVNTSGISNPCTNNSSTGITLNNGSSCVLSLAMESPTAIINNLPAFNFAGSQLFNLLGVSYSDNSGQVVTNSSSYTFGSQMNISANLFANMSESAVVTGSGYSANHTITETFTLTGSVPAVPSHLPLTITVTNLATAGLIYSNNPTCQITANNGNCNIVITALAGAPLIPYTYSYIVSPSGSSNGIKRSFSFTLQ